MLNLQWPAPDNHVVCGAATWTHLLAVRLRIILKSSLKIALILWHALFAANGG
jgi:hypothetical protein